MRRLAGAGTLVALPAILAAPAAIGRGKARAIAKQVERC
jgi:hypothetical protein